MKTKLRKATIVVEIGNDWLKVLESAPAPAGSEIMKMSLLKLSQIKEGMSAAVSKIFKDLSLGKQSVVLCIPRHLITVRVLDLPSTDSREINDMVNLQVGKQTPYSKEEIVSAHNIMYSDREGYTKVILAVAHRNIINVRIETLKSAGINIDKVLISSEGVYNWFSLLYSPQIKPAPSETVALLDIDSNYSDFIAIRNGKLVFTKNIFLGANHLLNEPGPSLSKLVEELKRCLKRYSIEEKNSSIKKLYLCGAAKGIEGIDVILADSLDIAAEKTDALKNVKMKDDIRFAQMPNMKFVSLTPVLGMALGSPGLGLDMTPVEQKVSKLMEKKRKDLTIVGVLFISIVMTLSFLSVMSLYYKNTYLGQLKKKVAEVSNESGDVDKMRAGIELAKRTLDAKKSSLNILREIYALVPPEISLGSIDVDENKQVVLKGRGFVMSDVFKFVKKLEDSPIFADVKASYTRTKKEKEGDRETEYVEFEIVCPYKK